MNWSIPVGYIELNIKHITDHAHSQSYSFSWDNIKMFYIMYLQSLFSKYTLTSLDLLKQYLKQSSFLTSSVPTFVHVFLSNAVTTKQVHRVKWNFDGGALQGPHVRVRMFLFHVRVPILTVGYKNVDCSSLLF